MWFLPLDNTLAKVRSASCEQFLKERTHRGWLGVDRHATKRHNYTIPSTNVYAAPAFNLYTVPHLPPSCRSQGPLWWIGSQSSCYLSWVSRSTCHPSPYLWRTQRAANVAPKHAKKLPLTKAGLRSALACNMPRTRSPANRTPDNQSRSQDAVWTWCNSYVGRLRVNTRKVRLQRNAYKYPSTFHCGTRSVECSRWFGC